MCAEQTLLWELHMGLSGPSRSWKHGAAAPAKCSDIAGGWGGRTGSGGQEHCPDRMAEGLTSSVEGFPCSLLSMCAGRVVGGNLGAGAAQDPKLFAHWVPLSS